MSIALTPNPANFSTVTVILPQDGIDFRTASSLYPAFQRLTDNDAYIAANFLYKNVGTFALAQALSFTGFGVTFANGCQVNNALGVAGGIVAAGGLLIDNVIASGNVQMQNASVAAVLSFTGAGHARRRRSALPDSDATIAIATADFFSAQTLTATRTFTLSTSGAVIGDEIEVFNASTTNFLNVVNGSGVLSTLRNASGNQRSARFMFNPAGSGDWVCISESEET